MTDVLDPELMSVATDEVVVTFRTEPGVEVRTSVGEREFVTTGPYHAATITGLEPDTTYRLEVEGAEVGDYLPVSVHTLAQPKGARLATVATANDVHFGETVAGAIEGFGDVEIGPVFRSDPGQPPYPDMMNAAAIAEITALGPDAVVVKGDLTTNGNHEELELFKRAWSVFGHRLHHVRGNHDAYHDPDLAVDSGAPYTVTLPGVTLAVIDTVIPGQSTGCFRGAMRDWLAGVLEGATTPVIVFGHHHIWNPGSATRHDTYFGIHPDDSEALIALAERHPAFSGYYAGHTHRNRVRRFSSARDVPFAEVACLKDYPGAWAEYRIYEGGYVQVMRRVLAPQAMAWTEKTRGMFAGLYRDYALGALHDRCFTQPF